MKKAFTFALAVLSMLALRIPAFADAIELPIEDKSDSTIIIVLVAAVVIIAAVILITVLRRRKK